MVLEKTLESPLDCKEIQPVNPKGNHSWIFIGRTNAEAEMPVLWPPTVKNWLTVKDPDAGNDWRWGRRGRQRMRWLDGITDSMDMSWVNSGSWWWTGRPGVVRFMGSQRVGHDWAAELNWSLYFTWPHCSIWLSCLLFLLEILLHGWIYVYQLPLTFLMALEFILLCWFLFIYLPMDWNTSNRWKFIMTL